MSLSNVAGSGCCLAQIAALALRRGGQMMDTSFDLTAGGRLSLYTLDQVSETTGWSLSHLRRAIRAGKLIHHQLGRSIRISHADLEAFLATSRSMNDAAKKRAKSTDKNPSRRTSG